MSDLPKLTLPPREEWSAAPRRRSLLPVLFVIGLAAVIGLELYQVLRRPPPGPAATPTPATRTLLPAPTLREVAVRLQRDNLHAAAAQAYLDYLAASDLPGPERGNILLESANLLAKAGKYEEALGLYFRAEHLISEANAAPLRRQVQECLRRLGKHAEQGYELADQLAPRPAGQAGKQEGKTAGDQDAGKIVAWMGPEKITASDLDDLIAREIEDRALAIPGLPPERVAELKAQAQKQLASPQARLAKLREILAKKVLYREGLEREVDKSSRVQKRFADLSEAVVVEEMVLGALRDRIKVSESDLRTFHRANPERYRQRASAKVRIALVADEVKARELLAAKSEEEFGRLAKESSLDAATRDAGGLLEEPLVQGHPVPGLGSAPELEKAIFAVSAPGPIPAPVKTAAGYAAVFVRERAPERTPPFEEVRERIGRDYVQEKEAEVQQDLVRELFEKHRVSVLTEAFLPAAGAPRSKDEKKDEKNVDPAAVISEEASSKEAGSRGSPKGAK